MSRSPDARLRRLHRCLASLFSVLASCAQLPPTSSVVIPPIPAGAARIWIYRNDGPYEAQQTPFARLNGRVTGVVQPNGALYRDVPPGHYSVTVDSYGVPYPNQFVEFNLCAGQEAFVKSCRCGKRWAANSASVPAPASSPSSSRRRRSGCHCEHSLLLLQ